MGDLLTPGDGEQDDQAEDDQAEDDGAQDDQSQDGGAEDGGAEDDGAEDDGAEGDQSQEADDSTTSEDAQEDSGQAGDAAAGDTGDSEDTGDSGDASASSQDGQDTGEEAGERAGEQGEDGADQEESSAEASASAGAEESAEENAEENAEEEDSAATEDEEQAEDEEQDESPCPEEKKVAGTDEQTAVTLPNDSWYLEASSLTLYGLDYHGVVNVTTEDGTTKQVLKFTAKKIDIVDLHQIVDGEGTVRRHVATEEGSTSTFRNGTVTMYTERISGKLFGLVDVTYDAEHQPPLDLPLANFTDVSLTQAGQFGGELTMKGMSSYISHDGPTQTEE